MNIAGNANYWADIFIHPTIQSFIIQLLASLILDKLINTGYLYWLFSSTGTEISKYRRLLLSCLKDLNKISKVSTLFFKNQLCTVGQRLPFHELLLELKKQNRDTFTFLSCTSVREARLNKQVLSYWVVYCLVLHPSCVTNTNSRLIPKQPKIPTINILHDSSQPQLKQNYFLSPFLMCL